MTQYIALYCRLSPRPDGGYEGVDLQEKWGREYAAVTWPGIPVEVFADKGISAYNGDQRDGYDRFREWLTAGRIAHVWTVEQSRLERREVEWFELAAELDACGISEVHTNREGIISVRGEVAGIKAVLAAGEARKLRQRVNDRLGELAAEGRPSGGRTFGYEHVRDEENRATLRVVEDQAEILREAADRILSGWSLTHAAADLTERGVRGANGAKITYKTLNRMITNPTVAGYRVYRGAVVGRGLWQPILDDATWQAVRAKLAAPRTVRARGVRPSYAITEHQYGSHSTRSRRRYLLTGGIAICGVCDVAGAPTPMRAQRRKVHGDRLDAIYTCWHGFHVGVMADPLEQHVADELLRALDKPEFLQAIAAADHSAQRNAILAALGAAENQRAELAAMWATPGGLTAAEWRSARDTIEEREHKLRAELSELPAPLVDVDMSKVRAAWPSMTLDERRELVELFITRVLVNPARPGAKQFDPQRIKIEWRGR